MCADKLRDEFEQKPKVLVILHLFKGLTEKGKTYFRVECTLLHEMTMHHSTLSSVESH